MDGISEFNGIVNGEIAIPAARILHHAAGENFEALVLIGRLPDGSLYVAGTHGPAETLFLIEQSKPEFMGGV